jgi:hypothetical protein
MTAADPNRQNASERAEHGRRRTSGRRVVAPPAAGDGGAPSYTVVPPDASGPWTATPTASTSRATYPADPTC